MEPPRLEPLGGGSWIDSLSEQSVERPSCCRISATFPGNGADASAGGNPPHAASETSGGCLGGGCGGCRFGGGRWEGGGGGCGGCGGDAVA